MIVGWKRQPINECEMIYYYSLKDFVNIAGASLYPDNYDTFTTPETMRDLLGWNESAEQSFMTPILKNEFVIHLWHLLLAKYWQEFIVISDEKIEINSDLDKATINKLFGEFWRLFEARLQATYERYTTILNLFKTQKENLLNPIKSSTTSKSRFNETPQASDIDPFDENYSNNSQTGEILSENDLSTLANRLDEIDRLWENKIEDWANEFSMLFMEKGDKKQYE